MSDDPHAAGRAVVNNVRNAVRRVREQFPDMPQAFLSFEDPDRSAWPPGPGDRMIIPIIIGARDKLTKVEAEHCAYMWREVAQRYPKAYFMLMILGYDEDPRELLEFPDVRRYVRRWARLAGLDDIEEADRWIGSTAGRIETPDSKYLQGGLGLLAACGVFGESFRQVVLRNNGMAGMVAN